MFNDGFIYAGIPPLYRLKNNKEVVYLKDNVELEVFKQKNDLNKWLVSRCKGLGELSVEETEECLINENTRNIQQIVVKNEEEAAKLFETLMGSDAAPRKKYIEENAEKAQIYV